MLHHTIKSKIQKFKLTHYGKLNLFYIFLTPSFEKWNQESVLGSGVFVAGWVREECLPHKVQRSFAHQKLVVHHAPPWCVRCCSSNYISLIGVFNPLLLNALESRYWRLAEAPEWRWRWHGGFWYCTAWAAWSTNRWIREGLAMAGLDD